ncbi:2-keto-4-pentenoate hydratase [Bryocella elongata]|uniref:2-keto-4-pentenoate hydratase n=1 Tax=Bryocella elongata TaxID=863522 RepID=A0A1H5ST51_9BACT|nr:fumarylacetoacetate hydrolase family protein [Bryocella elongata]SEF53695.1 2-keto-4-pentenoate hydratase [Bryocella elongata]
MTENREHALRNAASILIDTRTVGQTVTDLPVELQPVDMDEIYFVQDLVASAFGPVGGYKIGAPTPDAAPFFAPMPEAWINPNGATLSGPHWRFRALEAEIAFLVGEDLPPRETPYSREEVLAAMASCHPAIEVLESALADPIKAARGSSMGDLQMHGGFVPGPAVKDWQSIDFTKERVTVTVNGEVLVERVGSNTSGDFLRLLPFLANEGAARTGGLKRGQWITTGSWTGNTPVAAGSHCVAEFSTAGKAELTFA